MLVEIKPRLEDVNYREVEDGEASCVHCNHADGNLAVSDRGIAESKCYFFRMKVDGFHVCDLIC